MGFLQVDTSGLNLLKARLQLAQQRVPGAVQDGLDMLGLDVLGQLADAAPKGSGEGPPPPGDEDGPLAASFRSEVTSGGKGATLKISTVQPTKLKFVRDGRGEVFPVQAKALYWKGLPHPVMHAGPAQPNDFVTPILGQAQDRLDQLLSEHVREALGIIEE